MRNQCLSNLSLVERVERLEKEIVVENELNESEEFNSTTEVLRYFRNNRDLKWILNQGGYVLPHTRSGKNKNITIEFVKPYDINKYRGGKSAPDYVYLYRDWETDRKSTRLNSSHITRSRMPSSA